MRSLRRSWQRWRQEVLDSGGVASASFRGDAKHSNPPRVVQRVGCADGNGDRFAYQWMPYFAAIRRAFCSSVSRLRATFFLAGLVAVAVWAGFASTGVTSAGFAT